jgi:hypothetical protein
MRPTIAAAIRNMSGKTQSSWMSAAGPFHPRPPLDAGHEPVADDRAKRAEGEQIAPI